MKNTFSEYLSRSGRVMPVTGLLLTLLIMSGCGPQHSVRIRTPAQAAAETARLEPQPPTLADFRPVLLARDAGSLGRLSAPGGATALRLETSVRYYVDTWTRIRLGLKLPRPDRAEVRRELRWYANHQDYLGRISHRAHAYMPYIVRELNRRNMPLDLALLPILESAYQPFAYSRAGASGIWQFISSTGRRYGLRQTTWYDGRRDVIDSTRAALDYLQKLHKEFNGDWLLALAAYNAGEGAVGRAIAKNRALGKPTDFWSLNLPAETEAYVPKLLSLATLVSDPKRYNVTLEPVPDIPYFGVVPIQGQMRLSQVAKLSGLPLDEVRRLNAGFRKDFTSPDGPHRVLLPRDHLVRFKKEMDAMTPQNTLAARNG